MESVMNERNPINRELLTADQFRKLRNYEYLTDSLYSELEELMSYPPFALEFNGINPELWDTICRLRAKALDLLQYEIPETFEPFFEVDYLHPIKIARHYANESQWNYRIAFKLWQRDNPWYVLTDPDGYHLGY